MMREGFVTMEKKTIPKQANDAPGPPEGHKEWAFSEMANRPEVVLSVLEPDQLVAAKERTRFGPKQLSAGVRAQLWGLRIFVIIMMIIVAVSVIQAIRAAH
jgi:hypothetical protein